MEAARSAGQTLVAMEEAEAVREAKQAQQAEERGRQAKAMPEEIAAQVHLIFEAQAAEAQDQRERMDKQARLPEEPGFRMTEFSMQAVEVEAPQAQRHHPAEAVSEETAATRPAAKKLAEMASPTREAGEAGQEQTQSLATRQEAMVPQASWSFVMRVRTAIRRTREQ